MKSSARRACSPPSRQPSASLPSLASRAARGVPSSSSFPRASRLPTAPRLPSAAGCNRSCRCPRLEMIARASCGRATRRRRASYARRERMPGAPDGCAVERKRRCDFAPQCEMHGRRGGGSDPRSHVVLAD
eukprot:275437-Prymnesium_polylepis.1